MTRREKLLRQPPEAWIRVVEYSFHQDWQTHVGERQIAEYVAGNVDNRDMAEVVAYLTEVLSRADIDDTDLKHVLNASRKGAERRTCIVQVRDILAGSMKSHV